MNGLLPAPTLRKNALLKGILARNQAVIRETTVRKKVGKNLYEQVSTMGGSRKVRQGAFINLAQLTA